MNRSGTDVEVAFLLLLLVILPTYRASIWYNCNLNSEAKVAIHLLSLSCWVSFFFTPTHIQLIELAVRNEAKGKRITCMVSGKAWSSLRKAFP